jgi:hypothetical protein
MMCNDIQEHRCELCEEQLKKTRKNLFNLFDAFAKIETPKKKHTCEKTARVIDDTRCAINQVIFSKPNGKKPSGTRVALTK